MPLREQYFYVPIKGGGGGAPKLCQTNGKQFLVWEKWKEFSPNKFANCVTLITVQYTCYLMDIVYQVLYHYIHTVGNFGESCGKVAFSEYIKVVGFKGTIQRVCHFVERTFYMSKEQKFPVSLYILDWVLKEKENVCLTEGRA